MCATQTWNWYLNGVEQAGFTNSDGASFEDLTTYTDLPLRPGDVVGFRWKGEYEQCYTHLSSFTINGTSGDTRDSNLVRHIYNANFEQGWVNQVHDESAWTPANESIIGQDLFSTITDDQRPGNYYWRIVFLRN